MLKFPRAKRGKVVKKENGIFPVSNLNIEIRTKNRYSKVQSGKKVSLQERVFMEKFYRWSGERSLPMTWDDVLAL